MARQGFDNDQYLKLQSQHIQERIAQFGGKLYHISFADRWICFREHCAEWDALVCR